VLCGKNGESSGLLDCCVNGTKDCSGTCTTTGTYTSNDGNCTGACYTAYTQTKDQCGLVVDATSGTFTNTSCSAGCTRDCAGCKGTCNIAGHARASFYMDHYCHCFDTCYAGATFYQHEWIGAQWVLTSTGTSTHANWCAVECL
jgi:hypothetical protein